ncbi:PKD domain-containing protein [Pontiellaceae bacterium B1224]|nr:PKD domain-containing protein [Pontiellaceae bacterium B1224]
MKVSRKIMLLFAGVLVAGISQAALVGHWEFEEGSGSTAADSTGNYDGVIFNPVWTNNAAIGSGALYFDGSPTAISNGIPTSVTIGNVLGTVSNELSIAFWCYGDPSQKVQQNAFSGFTGNSRLLNCHFPWSGPTIYFDANRSGTPRNRITKGVPVGDYSTLWGQWNHWVFTKNATDGTMAMYVNGDSTPYASGTGQTNVMTGITSFFIGSSGGSTAYYHGLLDDFRVYDHELSGAEITELFTMKTSAIISASTLGGPPPLEVIFDGSSSASSTNIVSYNWDFGDGTTTSGMIVTNTYSATGEYTASLEVIDANGSSGSSSVDISVAHFVTAAVSATPTVGEYPLEVAFDASASTSSTSIVSYDWDFGDGNMASGVNATNTYMLSGVYTAAVVVVDSNGLIDTNSVVIEVSQYVGADLVVTAEGFDIATLPSFLTDDLAQTQFLSALGVLNGATSTTNLFDGSIGNTDGSISGAGEVRWDANSSVTLNFDVSVNTYGYDITEISSIAGWNPGGGGRANQGYGIRVTYADGSEAVLADSEHWAPNDGDTNYWTKVTFVETNGLAMAKNVKSVTFDNFFNANAGGVVVGREIDILGVPSGQPVPDVIVLELADGGTSLSWASDSSYQYSVQSTLNLAVGTWSTFTNVVGTPPQTKIVLPQKNQAAEFYRVIFE